MDKQEAGDGEKVLLLRILGAMIATVTAVGG